MSADVRSTAGPGPVDHIAYPPAPWQLAGHACFSVFVLPAAQLPTTPDGFEPLVIARHGVVIAGWVEYRGGSVLEYGELCAAVAGRFRGRPAATVTHMWVDSEPSREGGRALWGYPKELAELDLRLSPGGSAAAWAAGREVAHGTFRARFRLPRLPRVRTGTVQVVGGRLAPIPCAGDARPVLGRGTFSPAPDGPLGFLATGRRVATFGVQDFRATFG